MVLLRQYNITAAMHAVCTCFLVFYVLCFFCFYIFLNSAYFVYFVTYGQIKLPSGSSDVFKNK